MYHIELSPEEYAVLNDVLTASLTEIRHEIHHTDTRGFRALLVHRENVLAALIARLAQLETVSR